MTDRSAATWTRLIDEFLKHPVWTDLVLPGLVSIEENAIDLWLVGRIDEATARAIISVARGFPKRVHEVFARYESDEILPAAPQEDESLNAQPGS